MRFRTSSNKLIQHDHGTIQNTIGTKHTYRFRGVRNTISDAL